MGKLTVSMNVTLDGCCDHTKVIADDELHGYAMHLIETAAGLLFGRVTYELFHSYWPSVAKSGSSGPAEAAFACKLEVKPKYQEWHRTSPIKGGGQSWERKY